MLELPPLFDRLAPATSVLISGAGGGFDIYAGLPIALALHRQGKTVALANMTFSSLASVPADAWIGPGVAEIGPETPGAIEYFPERTLARWLASESLPWPVHAIERGGVRPVTRSYRVLHERLGLDAVVLVDGGTDILLSGDEYSLGTPEEDITSLLAASELSVPIKLVTSLGFGIDAYHGVCHAHVLENLAALTREGAYLGALSIPPDSVEALKYLDAV